MKFSRKPIGMKFSGRMQAHLVKGIILCGVEGVLIETDAVFRFLLSKSLTYHQMQCKGIGAPKSATLK